MNGYSKLFIVLAAILMVSGAFALTSYENWASGEPNDQGGEDCTEMYDNGNWNDLSCGDSNPGICEFPNGTYEQTSSLSWTDARDECVSRGGYLAVINDQSENDYVKNNFPKVWISYHDRNKEGIWDRAAYENWKDTDNEPNDLNGEDCAEMYDGGQWNDNSCGNSRTGVCEFPDGHYESTSSLSWSDARDECKSRGAHLVTIDSPSDQSDVKNNYGKVWIGYSDQLDEGDWSFVDRVTAATGWVHEIDLNQASQEIDAVAFSANNNYVAYAAGSNVYIHDYGSWNHVKTISVGSDVNRRGLAFSPSDDRLAIETDNTIYVYEIGSWSQETTISNDAKGGVAFSPDGNYLGSTMGNNDLFQIYNVGTWTTQIEVSDTNWADYGGDFSPGSDYWAVGKGHGGVPIYDISNGNKVDTLSAASDWRSYAVDFSTNYVMHGNDDSNCYVYDASSWNHLQTLSNPSGGTGRYVDISGDESWVGCTNHDNDRIYVWSIDNSWQLNDTFTSSGAFMFSNDGTYIAYEETDTLVIERYKQQLQAPNEPENPDPADGEIVRTSSITVSARYTHPDGDSGTLTFYNASDNVEIGSCSVNDGGRCGVTWNGLDHGANNWYAIAESGGKVNQSETWTVIYNQPPKVDSLDSPPDGSTVYGTSTDLVATVSDPDGDSLGVIFYNNLTGAQIASTTVSGTAGGTQASVEWSGLTRGDTYEWHAIASDPWETDQVDSDSSFYVNQLPNVYDPVPEDNALVDNSDVNMEVTATDPEGNDVTVYFINDSDRTVIGKSGTDSSDKASTTWYDREIGNTYTWYVNASDGRENLTSIRWSFKRSLSGGFRPITRIKHRYTSIVAGPDSPAYFSFTVENRIAESKNLNTSLSGVNAEFLDGGWYRVYNLGPEAKKRFQVKVSPRKLGRFTLDVKTENQDLGISQTDSIPVYSRDAESKSVPRNVPGIGIIQVVFIVILSTVLVSASL